MKEAQPVLQKLTSSSVAKLTSAGTISDRFQAVVTAQRLELTAAAAININDSADNVWRVSWRTTFDAGGNLTVGSAGNFQTSSLMFVAGGDATISSDAQLHLFGENIATNASLDAVDSISDGFDATLLIANQLNLDSGNRILLADKASNEISVGDTARLNAQNTVRVFDAGNVDFARLKFDGVNVLVNTDSRIHLVESSSATNLNLQSPNFISDSPTATLVVADRTSLTAPRILLADNVNNELQLCGYARFNVTKFVRILPDGFVTMDRYSASSNVEVSISIDEGC